MKGKLIKVNDYYYLRELSKSGIGGSPCERTLGTTNSSGELGKLSKQNCDEIFGIVDVEKLAERYYGPGDYGLEIKTGFIKGFNKALQLNKDKQFTEEDVKRAFIQGSNFTSPDEVVLNQTFGESMSRLIKSLQQPSEIEVEVVMQCIDPNCDSLNRKGCCIPGDKPRIDAEGYLILKKI